MSYTDFYCDAAAGSNLNGGGLATGAEPAAAAAYTSTSGNWDGTSVFTPTDSSTPSVSVNVGDWASVYTNGSGGPTGYIARVTAIGAGANGTITLSTTAKAGSVPGSASGTITIKVGGRWLGPNGSSGFPFNVDLHAANNIAGNGIRVNLKNNATYSITAQISCSCTQTVFQGYTTTAGDGGRATIDGGATGSTFTLLNVSGACNTIADLIVQNNGNSGTPTTATGNGVRINGQPNICVRVTATNIYGSGFADVAGAIYVECEASVCNQSNTAGMAGFIDAGAAGPAFLNCYSHNNSGSNAPGFLLNQNSSNPYFLHGCIADTNGAQGFVVGPASGSKVAAVLSNCDAYNNTGDGLAMLPTAASGQVQLFAQNCNFVKNGGYGVNGSGGCRGGFLYNCGFGSSGDANTSGATNALDGIVVSGSVTYTSPTNPYNAPTTGDFTITATAAKSAGRQHYTQSTNTKSGSSGSPDIGAVQALIHAASVLRAGGMEAGLGG